MKAIEQYSHMQLFILLYKMAFTVYYAVQVVWNVFLKSVDKILVYDHSKLLSSTFMWYCLLYNKRCSKDVGLKTKEVAGNTWTKGYGEIKRGKKMQLKWDNFAKFEFQSNLRSWANYRLNSQLLHKAMFVGEHSLYDF